MNDPREIKCLDYGYVAHTEWFWQNDLHNTLHFLSLRLDPHAQYEIRVYAGAMLDLIAPLFPTVIEAWSQRNA